MVELDKEQTFQEEMYHFPYHYIPTYDHGNFSQVKTLFWGYEYLSYIRFVLSKLQSLHFESLLDVGCGDGRFLYELSKTFPKRNLVGLDFSERSIMHARALNPNAKYLCGDITNTELMDEKFDVITLIETIEHIPQRDIQDFVTGLSYYLKENGILIVTTPTINVRVNPKHYQHFTLESLAAVVRPTFEVTEKYSLNKISGSIPIMEALMINRFFILNYPRLLNWLYHVYEKKLLHAEPHNAKRICILCKKQAAIT